MKRLLWVAHIALACITLLAYASPYLSPSVFWPAAFASLAFPTLLICHILLAGFWLYQRTWRWLLSVAVIAIGAKHIAELYGTGNPESAESSISFTTFNIYGGRYLYERNEDSLRQNVSAWAACVESDVLALQESPRYASIVTEVKQVLRKRGYNYSYHPEQTYLSLYSRYPLVQTDLLDAYNEANGALSTLVVPAAGDTLHVIAAHLQSNQVRLDASDLALDVVTADRQAYWTLRSVARNYRQAAHARVEQAEEIAKIVERRTYPTVVLGDFNDTPLSYPLGVLRRAGLIDAFRQNGTGLGITYPGTIPGLRIDYVLATPELKVLNASVLDCAFSDHKPTRAVFALPAQ